ncbi:hypothetical protein P9302_25645 [Brevibacillus agri]|uniref:hypothetical protein n=1 Tax=Brevibacillus agri TaxID=51101 RepID=UPI0004723C51|nr:hypothetical protein [Brevibacillus agri]MED4572809.1 hypothetical protein [Brevibacillus agri]WHX31008.1 hypothetical protein QNK09_01715 [Brevibacillus agri]
MVKYIEIEEIDVTHEFVKKHITFVLGDTKVYEEFYNDFQQYFFRSVLTEKPYESLMLFLNGHTIKNKQYIINNLNRIFKNDQHFKGIVGEHLFSFYFHKKVRDFLWSHGPKGRSSAEPGIDYITFTGDPSKKNSINVTIWETKTTENSVSTRASQIYDFFSENGSFEENIDSEIKAIQELFQYRPDDNLKEKVSDLYETIINREFCIGATGISSNFTSTNDTFKQFGECFKSELTKDQRLVKLVFIDLLTKILDDLRDRVWNRLQTP